MLAIYTYNNIFIVGPCSVRLSQLKPVDVPVSTSPTELVERMKYVRSSHYKAYLHHTQYRVLSSRCPKYNAVNSYVWDHMESLYQHSNSTCLFGKNNTVIVMVNV